MKRLEAKRQFSAVDQMVGFGLRRSKMLYLSMGVDRHSLRHIILKYKVNICFPMVDSRIACGRDGILEASVIRSEIRSRAELNCALPLFLHLHTNEIPRTDPLA
jgi:hypothetical protein